MMGYFEDLTKTFDAPLKSFGAANSILVALENINAPTSTDKPFLAGFMLLDDTLQADLGFNERRSGIYQVDINYRSTDGSAPINKMADSLNNLFKTGVQFSRNDICASIQSVSLGPLIVQNGWAKRPLSINFIAFTKRL